MTRREVDKEDLLREATALVQRAELELLGDLAVPHVIAGFRHKGAASFFFGADPVYHFNEDGELRRAYCDGLLIKANDGKLFSLRRERRQGEIQLLRHDFTDAEQNEFVQRMQNALADLRMALESSRYKVVQQEPRDADFAGRLFEWLTRHDGSQVADRPNVI